MLKSREKWSFQHNLFLTWRFQFKVYKLHKLTSRLLTNVREDRKNFEAVRMESFTRTRVYLVFVFVDSFQELNRIAPTNMLALFFVRFIHLLRVCHNKRKKNISGKLWFPVTTNLELFLDVSFCWPISFIFTHSWANILKQ